MVGDFSNSMSLGVHMRIAHRSLRRQVAFIRSLFEEAETSSQPVSSLPIEQELSALCASLAHHFSEEEEGGCLEEAVIQKPRLARELRRIELEHASLLNRLKGLVEQAELAHNANVEPVTLREDFETFAQLLGEHEESENILLEEGLGIPAE